MRWPWNCAPAFRERVQQERERGGESCRSHEHDVAGRGHDLDELAAVLLVLLVRRADELVAQRAVSRVRRQAARPLHRVVVDPLAEVRARLQRECADLHAAVDVDHRDPGGHALGQRGAVTVFRCEPALDLEPPVALDALGLVAAHAVAQGLAQPRVEHPALDLAIVQMALAPAVPVVEAAVITRRIARGAGVVHARHVLRERAALGGREHAALDDISALLVVALLRLGEPELRLRRCRCRRHTRWCRPLVARAGGYIVRGACPPPAPVPRYVCDTPLAP